MLAAGTVLFEKYRVEGTIGQGGMACVVSATHLQLNEQVAIKMLLPELAQNPTVVQRFVREARAAVRLKGEHVTRVIDVGVLPWGAPYMVMELLAGVDLAQLLKEHGTLSPPEAVDCVLQVCEALAEAHAIGIVHRDIKPSNLFVTRRPDGSPLVKVLDFGISKVGFEDQHVTNLTQGSIIGTPSYMSPEQLRGSHDVDARSDIWSLGIVLYRLLAGVRPFKADSISALAIQAATEPTPLFTQPVPPGLDAIVYRCLEKDAGRRFQSVAELAYALAPYARDQRAAGIVIERTQNILRWSPPPPQPPLLRPVLEPTTLGSSAGAIVQLPPPARPRGRLGWLIGATAGAVIGAIVLVTSVSRRGSDKPAATTEPALRPAAATTVGPTVEPIEEPAVEIKPEPVTPEPVTPEPVTPEPVTPEPVTLEPAPAVAKPTPKPEPRHGKVTRPKPKPEPTVDVKPDPKPDVKPDPKPTPKPANPLDTRM